MSDALPVLAVSYGHRSIDVMSLRAATRGWCRIVWIVDAGDPSVIAVLPLLERFGAVVDVAGLSASEVAARLAEHEPQGIANFYDTSMERLAEVAALLQLDFQTPEAARALEDKLAQRAAFAAAGIETPATVDLPAAISAAEALRRATESGIRFPVVLKPHTASGSWHTFTVRSPDELVELWDDLADEPPEARLLEEYLSDGPPMPGGFEADYVSVESLMSAGRPIHLAITGRLPLAPPMRETGFFMPSTLNPELAREVLELAGRALRAVGARVGAMHTEIKLTAEGPRVIEVNGRIGGGVPEMLRLSTGVDIVALAMRSALGMAADVPALPAASCIGYRFFFQPPAEARRLKSIDAAALAQLQAEPAVDSVVLRHRPGDTLDARHGTRTYLFAVVGSAADHAGVVRMNTYLGTQIAVEYG